MAKVKISAHTMQIRSIHDNAIRGAHDEQCRDSEWFGHRSSKSNQPHRTNNKTEKVKTEKQKKTSHVKNDSNRFT